MYRGSEALTFFRRFSKLGLSADRKLKQNLSGSREGETKLP